MIKVKSKRLSFKSSRNDAFSTALKQESSAYLAAHNDHRFADRWFFIKAFFLGGLAVALYVSALHATTLMAFSILYVLCIFSSMVLAMNLLHDASHKAVFRSAFLNRWVNRLVVFPLGIDPDYWTIRHVRYHHTYPNIEGLDLDIDANAFLRQTPFQPYFKHFKFQHIYWPLVAGLSLPYINWVYDWADRLGKSELADDSVLEGVSGWIVFLSSKALHFTIALLLPILFLREYGITTGQIAGVYFLAQIVASCVLVALILGTHWADTSFYQADERGVMPHTWHAHSFKTTCDWQSNPRAVGYWLGGLNYHLTHHLFPTVNHRHYPALSRIVARLAAEHGLEYKLLNYPSLIRAQQKFLKQMGQVPPV